MRPFAAVTTEILIWMLASGAATGIGGIGLLLVRSPSRRMLDGLLGFTAGVMLAATAFSLLVPALERGTIAEIVTGFVVGFLAIAGLDSVMPHAHARFREHGELPIEQRAAKQRGALLVAALTIHNVPEGLAVGVAFAAGGPELGIPLALAIGIQNIPEGFAAGAPLIEAGTRRRRAVGIASVTGWVEPPAALLAFAAFELISALLAPGLAFAAGAMLYVVVDELIPESYGRGDERIASLGFLIGFALMMTLDNLFG